MQSFRRFGRGGMLLVLLRGGESPLHGYHGSVIQKRHQFTVPNRPGSGYRVQPPVPDRLKDALSNFGVDTRNIFPDDQDPAFVPEEKRKKMVSEIITSSSHLRNHSKLDRLRAALDKVHDCPSVFHESWKEVYLFLRTTEMCCEILKTDADVFPKGQKLWIELQECKEKRQPALLEMPNGMLVLPVFSMEEYMDHYFSLVDAFEACWFPVPRMGSRWDSFCAMEFPVAATGTLRYHSALATMALGQDHQVGVLVNPGQRTSKFITYPEMVGLAEIMNQRVRDRSVDLAVQNSETGEWDTIFPRGLITTFDTRKMKMKRVVPEELHQRRRNQQRQANTDSKAMAADEAIPYIARLELHLLLHQFEEIAEVYVRTVERPAWKKVFGAPQFMTQIDVIPFSADKKPPSSFLEALKKWSFIKEFNTDVHIQLTGVAPDRTTGKIGETCSRVYSPEDGNLLRSMTTFHGITLADSLQFNDPLTDENDRKPYEPYGGTV